MRWAGIGGRCVAGLALAWPLTPFAHAQLRRAGTEFQINSITAGIQSGPDVAVGASGDFVVAWEDNHTLNVTDVVAQRYTSSGAPLGAEIQVNTFLTSHQFAPALAMNADGDFVVVWHSNLQDGEQYGIFGQRFSSSGSGFAVEFQVNTSTLASQRSPSIAAMPTGDFVVLWDSSGDRDGSSYAVFAQRFSSAGAPLGGEFQVNHFSSMEQRLTSAAANAAGDFVAVWQSRSQDGSAYGIFGRRFSSAGLALGVEFQVNAYTSGYQKYPSIAANSNGDFVIAWQSNGQFSPYYGVFARRFSSAGDPEGGELVVNTLGRYPAVASAASAGFLVTWEWPDLDENGKSVVAQHYSGAGSPLDTNFLVNTHTADDQYRPAVATNDDGAFVVAWRSEEQDGSFGGVFGQRLAVLADLDVDGNGVLDPLTDGVLVLRFLFGFSGTTLTSDAVGPGCTRCDAAAIAPYLGGLGLALDIDGNVALDPLTDGLLVLRFLFGFTGSTLVTNAVGQGCDRCDATEIEPYLSGLTS
jgi:hypothetical protein